MCLRYQQHSPTLSGMCALNSCNINVLIDNFQTHMIFGIWETISFKTQDQVQVSTLDVLKCPSPAPYFVGREDTLSELVKIFAPPVVTIIGPNQIVLEEFLQQFDKRYVMYLTQN